MLRPPVGLFGRVLLLLIAALAAIAAALYMSYRNTPIFPPVRRGGVDSRVDYLNCVAGSTLRACAMQTSMAALAPGAATTEITYARSALKSKRTSPGELDAT